MVYSLVVTVELTAASQLPRFVAAFEAVHAVSNDPSVDSECLSYELMRATDSDKHLLILERFERQSSHKDIHRETAAFAAFVAWLRGPAQDDNAEGGRVVAGIQSRHFLNRGTCVAIDGSEVVVPAEIARLSRVEKVVRQQVSPAPAATAAAGGGASGQEAEAAAAPAVDPTQLRYEAVRNGVLVFGGARNGSRAEYVAAATAAGAAVAATGRPMVYGGGTVGVMGAAARAALAGGSRVIGVIPKALKPRELSGDCIGDVVVTKDMNERKRVMFAASSVVLSLAGGIGTLDELFEALTLFQLNALRHKIVLVNTCGIYDPLVAMLRAQIEAGFVEERVMNYFLLYNGPAAEVMTAVEAMELSPPAAPLNWKSDDEQNE